MKKLRDICIRIFPKHSFGIRTNNRINKAVKRFREQESFFGNLSKKSARRP